MKRCSACSGRGDYSPSHNPKVRKQLTSAAHGRLKKTTGWCLISEIGRHTLREVIHCICFSNIMQATSGACSCQKAQTVSLSVFRSQHKKRMLLASPDRKN